jgi:hypothetical protein
MEFQSFLRRTQFLSQAVWFLCTHHLHSRANSFCFTTSFGRLCNRNQVNILVLSVSWYTNLLTKKFDV